MIKQEEENELFSIYFKIMKMNNYKESFMNNLHNFFEIFNISRLRLQWLLLELEFPQDTPRKTLNA